MLEQSGRLSDPPMPDNAGTFDALLRFGPARIGPHGALVPLEWPDLSALADLGLIDSDDAELLRDMSKAYCDEIHGDGSPLSISPIERQPEGG